jgi:anti-anti-sigma factor
LKQFSLDSLEAAPGIGLLRLKGAMAKWDIDILALAVDKFFAHGITRIVLHLGETTHVASAAIGTFLSVHDRAAKEGGKMVLSSVPPHVRTIFARLGFQDMFVFAENLKAAVQILQEGSKPK